MVNTYTAAHLYSIYRMLFVPAHASSLFGQKPISKHPESTKTPGRKNDHSQQFQARPRGGRPSKIISRPTTRSSRIEMPKDSGEFCRHVGPLRWAGGEKGIYTTLQTTLYI